MKMGSRKKKSNWRASGSFKSGTRENGIRMGIDASVEHRTEAHPLVAVLGIDGIHRVRQRRRLTIFLKEGAFNAAIPHQSA